MTEIIDLPGGGTAALRDAATVSERHRRPVTRLQHRLAASEVGHLLATREGMSEEEFAERIAPLLGSTDGELLDELNDALIVALVDRLELPDQPPLPGLTVDGLLDLPGPVYDRLKVEAAKHVTALMPSFEPSPDPSSPTPPSAA